VTESAWSAWNRSARPVAIPRKAPGLALSQSASGPRTLCRQPNLIFNLKQGELLYVITCTKTGCEKPAAHRNHTAAAPVSVADEAVVSRNVEIETEEIAALAYSYWEARGCQAGSAEDDWLRAEQQLRAGG
jgi:Protein of unknown function (DUF2934)